MKGKKPPPGKASVKISYWKTKVTDIESPKKVENSVTKTHKVKVHPKLIELIGMDGAKFDIAADRSASTICSVTSSKLTKLAKKESSTKLIHYHKKYFTRVYPHGLKIDSSNYNPVKPWAMGAQVVALNFQTKDTGMLLNYAWF